MIIDTDVRRFTNLSKIEMENAKIGVDYATNITSHKFTYSLVSVQFVPLS